MSGNGDMDPIGDDFLAILDKPSAADLNIVEELLPHVTRKTGLAQDEAIMMPGATRSSRDARAVFAGLFADWVRREGRGRPEDGRWNAARAAAADATGDDLAWFALRQALLTHADLVVMGHTHTPIKGLTVAPLGVEYVNSGFECVSLPDAAKGTEFTFAHVDLEAPSARLIAVEEVGGQIRARAESSRTHGARGFSARKEMLPIPLRGLLLLCAHPEPQQERAAPRGEQFCGATTRSGSSRHGGSSPPVGGRTSGYRTGWGRRDPHGRFTYTDGTSNLNFTFSCPTLVPSTAERRRYPA